ncbi:MAG: hypothetical protein EZS28_049865, partial [Streblomastix strix]
VGFGIENDFCSRFSKREKISLAVCYGLTVTIYDYDEIDFLVGVSYSDLSVYCI